MLTQTIPFQLKRRTDELKLSCFTRNYNQSITSQPARTCTLQCSTSCLLWFHTLSLFLYLFFLLVKMLVVDYDRPIKSRERSYFRFFCVFFNVTTLTQSFIFFAFQFENDRLNWKPWKIRRLICRCNIQTNTPIVCTSVYVCWDWVKVNGEIRWENFSLSEHILP